MKNKEFAIMDFPKVLAEEAYQSATDEFIDTYRKNLDIISIFTFGSIKYPGISDVDFIVVTKDKPDFGFDANLLINNLAPDKRSTIYHEPFILPISIYKNFGKIFPLKNPRLLYGDSIDVNSSDTVDDLLLAVYFINQFYPQVFENLLYSRLRIRFSLQIISAFVHFLYLTTEFSRCAELSYLEGRINILRASWFEKNVAENINNLRYLLEQCIVISKKHIFYVNNYIKDNYWCLKKDAAKKKRGDGQNIFDYCGIIFAHDDFRGQVYEDIRWSIFLKNGYLINVVPEEMVLPLLVYAKQGGLFGDFIKKNLKTNLNLDDFEIKNNAIVRRIEQQGNMFNQHVEFYKKYLRVDHMLHDYYKMVKMQIIPYL